MDAMKLPGTRIACALVTCLASSAALATATPAAASPAAGLQARHEALAGALAHNAFGRPLALESREESRRVSGDVYAVLDYPFATVSRAFANPRTWCEVLILHLNTKSCRAGGVAGTNTLAVRMGRKDAREPGDG